MFLHDPTGAEESAFLEKDRAANGYVMNLERVWAWPRGFVPRRRRAARNRRRCADTSEAALRRWAQRVVHDPNSASAEDVDTLGAAGLSDREIFEATVYVALRLAFSTVNDALGARPDTKLVADAPAEVLAAVTYGRVPSG